MARTIAESEIISWARVVGTGVAFAVVVWLLSLGISHFIIEPITCGVAGNAGRCSDALTISNGIATILTVVGAVFAGGIVGLARPFILAISAGAMLWGLAGWLDGLFWLEALGWCVLVGALTYLLFGWLNRTQSIALTIILTVVIILAERITLAL